MSCHVPLTQSCSGRIARRASGGLDHRSHASWTPGGQISQPAPKFLGLHLVGREPVNFTLLFFYKGSSCIIQYHEDLIFDDILSYERSLVFQEGIYTVTCWVPQSSEKFLILESERRCLETLFSERLYLNKK